MNPIQLAELAHRIADAAIVSDIECFCCSVQSPFSTARWYDTRPMLDPNEHADEVVDMNIQALEYADVRGLISRHPDKPHMVRIVNKGNDHA
jgi:hypothetical protein